MGTVVEFDPLDLIGFEVTEGFDLETGESGVEVREGDRIRAVQSDQLVSRSHVGHLTLLVRD